MRAECTGADQVEQARLRRRRRRGGRSRWLAGGWTRVARLGGSPPPGSLHAPRTRNAEDAEDANGAEINGFPERVDLGHERCPGPVAQRTRSRA